MQNRDKNQGPVSLIYVDVTINSNAFAEKRKEILPFIISLNKTSSIKNLCISESNRLIADVIDICDKNSLG